MKLTNRDFLTLKDFSKDEILALIKFAKELKEKKKQGITGNHLQGKNIALIFEKPSTRTRCAFVVACNDEKAYPEYLGANDIQLGKKESIQDTARVLSRMFDGIEFRGFNQSDLETLAKYSDVPVWNGLTNEFHPTQILADMLTIYEHFNKLEGLNCAYIGDGRNNMANSLMIGCAKLGLNYINISPKELHPDNELINLCKSFANNSSIKISDNIEDIKGADIIYTDVWCSMGEEEKAKDRINILKPYQVNDELLLKTGKNTIIMHCLPAVKGNEITENVFENNADIIFNQAENRMHTIKAVMIATICDIDI
ncbi:MULTISPECIES: ornithine carbamoyltransferase [unclassified Campylobacter]|uniref:ornithine carbamoyltransferase n=1 Tax=unclassified Campylobacter TaxID=2593542 RepID=UPI001BD94317|nr:MULTISPECIES: ornithine carbamoyltransferase [unclassified Campylobacter]MBT0877867.1 ornithine carbamoyltransferase [Campylobacter sp. 2018MI01]MBT0882497.1 ornithine carbamoyltransferase [Campylobacter sp. 2018MI13]MBZ7983952.1 ornithine carbamoyltransferase [Campylobacter sp. RM12647]